LESKYLLFYAKIRWLNCGKCIERCNKLIEKIKIFMKENDYDVPIFFDHEWLVDLCFLTDITLKASMEK